MHPPPDCGIEIIAHRGYSRVAPENTVAAFQLAWDIGSDACELDLRLTGDDQIAVIHDAGTGRVTGVARPVHESPLAELQQLDAGSWKHSRYQGERIPSLAQALATLPEGRQRFFLEMKDGPLVVPVLARQLEAWRGRAERLCAMAFDRRTAQAAKQAMPWLPVLRLSAEAASDQKPVDLGRLIQETKDDGLDGLDLSRNWAWSTDLVRQVRDAGLTLFAWTVNRPEEVRCLAGWGLDGITTDDPVMARKALGRPTGQMPRG